MSLPQFNSASLGGLGCLFEPMRMSLRLVGRRWCRRRSSAASYRVIDNRSENLQHCQGGSMSSSLSRFSVWRSRSLSLGEGLPDSTGARDGTRADGGLDRGRRRLFSC